MFISLNGLISNVARRTHSGDSFESEMSSVFGDVQTLMRAAVRVEGPRGAPVPLNAKHARIARRLQMQQRMQKERAAAGGRGFCAVM